MLALIFLLAALVCFVLAAIEVFSPNVNLIAAGLALVTAAMLGPLVYNGG